MICPKCRNTIGDTAKFCTYCGNPVAFNTDPAFFDSLPAGITKTQDNKLRWQGECSAAGYKRSFLVPRWVIGVMYVLFMLIINFGIFPDDPLSARMKPMLVVTAAMAGAYLVSCLFIISNRAGVFHGEFVLTEDSVQVIENVQPPTGGFYGFLHGMFFFLSIITAFFLLFSDNYGNNLIRHDGDANAVVYQSASYEKIMSITPSPDKSYITVKAGLGKLRLLVTPAQCDYVVKELENRSRTARQ